MRDGRGFGPRPSIQRATLSAVAANHHPLGIGAGLNGQARQVKHPLRGGFSKEGSEALGRRPCGEGLRRQQPAKPIPRRRARRGIRIDGCTVTR
jgi:hypothetical protein